MNSSTIGKFPIPMFFLHFSFEPVAILVGRLQQAEACPPKNVFVLLLLLWTQPTSSTPRPIYTCTAPTHAEIKNDRFRESPTRIANLPSTSLLVIWEKLFVFLLTTCAQWVFLSCMNWIFFEKKPKVFQYILHVLCCTLKKFELIWTT